MELRKKRLSFILVLSILMVIIGFTCSTFKVNAAVLDQVVFIDNSIPDYEVLVDSIPLSLKVVVLDGNKDGVYQIADYLKKQRNMSAIHIISHGKAGKIHIGTAALSVKTLQSYGEQLTVIRENLAETGDILLYGCYVGNGEKGEQLLKEIAQNYRSRCGSF